MRTRWLRSLPFALGLLACAASARAQTVSPHYERGVQARRQGHDDEGLREFRVALAEEQSARARAQVGLTLAALGQWVESERYLQGALDNEDAWVRRNRATLQRALDGVAAHLGMLDVRGGVAGAALSIDGEPMGTLPLQAPLHVAAGTVNLQVSAIGYLPTTRRVVITPRVLARETVSLAPAPYAPSGAPAAAPEPVAAAPVQAPEVVTSPGRGQTQRVLGFVLGGAAIGALGLGVGASLLQLQETDYLLANAPCNSLDCDLRREREGTWYAVSIAGYVSAGALAATTLVLFLTAPSGRTSSPRASVGCVPWAAGQGVSCGGVF
ncbi:MAG: hypothetical protein Q8S73_10660 [Deltaproteobacteria bacterium]|nr:hypothetical protein [Myxococcales bacterium]MDP3214555.1 hypothetical protein [Deltaproteobacteria bacterium]